MPTKIKSIIPLNKQYHLDQDQIQQEQDWINLAKKDPAQFKMLYDKYFEAIFGFVYRRTDDEDISADLTSQTFLKALQNLKKYQDRGLPFSAWLYRIAINELNKFYRSRQKKKVFSLEEHLVIKLIWVEEQEPNDQESLLQQVLQDLNNLKTEEVEILELRFFEERSFKEIAYILEISESSAKMRTYRALEKLKNQLKQELR
ncbi:MAG: RNA polymerase sigma factor [Candidatus Cyclobacteriaceae bacterium M3_2C_046]